MEILTGLDKMIVTDKMVRDKFLELIESRSSRENVATFAARAIIADGNQNLELLPDAKFKEIWKAIDYLSGVDLKIDPDTYLHSSEEFKVYFESLAL
jgi:hypothetical protein